VGISRREALVRLWSASALLVIACRPDRRPTIYQGLIVDMQAASFVQIASFTLRTDDGQLIEMICEGDVGITPGHMRDHMALAEPVSVPVKYEGNKVIAIRVDDAPTSAPPVPAQAAPAPPPRPIGPDTPANKP